MFSTLLPPCHCMFSTFLHAIVCSPPSSMPVYVLHCTSCRHVFSTVLFVTMYDITKTVVLFVAICSPLYLLSPYVLHCTSCRHNYVLHCTFCRCMLFTLLFVAIYMFSIVLFVTMCSPLYFLSPYVFHYTSVLRWPCVVNTNNRTLKSSYYYYFHCTSCRHIFSTVLFVAICSLLYFLSPYVLHCTSHHVICSPLTLAMYTVSALPFHCCIFSTSPAPWHLLHPTLCHMFSISFPPFFCHNYVTHHTCPLPCVLSPTFPFRIIMFSILPFLCHNYMFCPTFPLP